MHQITAMGTEYYAWRVPGKPVEVWLGLHVVSRMASGVLHSQPRGGQAEHWGLLLGPKASRGRVVVEDFEPLLTPPKRLPLAAPEGSEWRVVGLYRVAPGESFRLDGTDAGVIERVFKDPRWVYLLARPGEDSGLGAFFIQEQGFVHGYASYPVFPFDPDLLRQSGPIERREPLRGSRRRAMAAGVASAVTVAVAGAWYFAPSAEPVSLEPPPALLAAPAPSLTAPAGTVSDAGTALRKQVRPGVTSRVSKSSFQKSNNSPRVTPPSPESVSRRRSAWRRMLSRLPVVRRLVK